MTRLRGTRPPVAPRDAPSAAASCTLANVPVPLHERVRVTALWAAPRPTGHDPRHIRFAGPSMEEQQE
jgi:hypothetical protein